ncbi:MAG: hypothetical protein E7368_01975 [Clostridiales bacterium]|nr:hypothetical protein [Clostridiales bacterium]
MLVWYALLALTLGLAVIISSVILPRMYLKSRYKLIKSEDRGIKKIMEKNGQTLVLEPAVKWRKYIKQYILSERGGKKQLMCKINDEIEYLSYDIALFNNRDKVFDVITIKERIDKEGFTKTVDLPEETSYVALHVNAVDGVEFPSLMTGKVKAGSAVKFILLCSLCIFMETFCVKVCCAQIFGGIFREVFILNLESTLVTIAISLFLILINVGATILTLLIRGQKKSGWDRL